MPLEIVVCAVQAVTVPVGQSVPAAACMCAEDAAAASLT